MTKKIARTKKSSNRAVAARTEIALEPVDLGALFDADDEYTVTREAKGYPPALLVDAASALSTVEEAIGNMAMWFVYVEGGDDTVATSSTQVAREKFNIAAASALSHLRLARAQCGAIARLGNAGKLPPEKVAS